MAGTLATTDVPGVVSSPGVMPGAARAATSILFAISFAHLLNDLIQSLLPAIYPLLKTNYGLSFAQIGWMAFTFQVTASLLQPVVGAFTDRRPMPYSLPFGMAASLAGLLMLSWAHGYGFLLVAAGLVGLGSSIFHPESSRVARMASGGRPGLAQSVFQVGGNAGQAVGPLLAAFVVVPWGQGSVAWFSLAALLGMLVLSRVGVWYSARLAAGRGRPARRMLAAIDLPHRRVVFTVGILLMLIFSKYFYMASLNTYYTFYLIEHFHVSMQDAQIDLFIFLAATAAGIAAGGPIGDRYGRKYVIWGSILGVLPFTLALPFVGLAWTVALTIPIGLILSSAFSAILVYAQELLPGRIGTVSGLFFGFAFGIGGIGAAALGHFADLYGIDAVYQGCALLPAIGLLAAFLRISRDRAMPFDEMGGGGNPAVNVLGGRLTACSMDPLTGFHRDGCCRTSPQDHGSHTVCARVTAAFLAFSKARGNDLSTPGRNSGSPGCGLAINGAYVRPGGRRRLRPDARRTWSLRRRRPARWPIAAWKT